MVVFPEAGGPSKIILGAVQTNRPTERRTHRRDRDPAHQNHIATEHNTPYRGGISHMNNGQMYPDALYTYPQLLSRNHCTCSKIYTSCVCSQTCMSYDCLSVCCPVCMLSHVKEAFLLWRTITFSESESEFELEMKPEKRRPTFSSGPLKQTHQVGYRVIWFVHHQTGHHRLKPGSTTSNHSTSIAAEAGIQIILTWH